MQINRKEGELALQGAEGDPPTRGVPSPDPQGGQPRPRGNSTAEECPRASGTGGPPADTLHSSFSHPLVTSHCEEETRPGNSSAPPRQEVSGKDTEGDTPFPEDSLRSGQAPRPAGHCQRDLIQKCPRRSAQHGPEEGGGLALCCVFSASVMSGGRLAPNACPSGGERSNVESRDSGVLCHAGSGSTRRWVGKPPRGTFKSRTLKPERHSRGRAPWADP